MPELPEVETVRRVLSPRLVGKTIADVRIGNAQVIESPAPEKFIALVKGQTIAAFSRRGKFLLLLFESGDSLTIHLRMTGCLTLEPCGAPCEKHTHLIFTLGDGSELRYEDVRRFGKFRFTARGGEDACGPQKLGPEPLCGAVDAAYLRGKCAKSGRPVKALLLDQRVVAGIGNIYSDEILFAAKIRPDKPCRALTGEELARLAAAIPERLAYFIRKNETTFEEYSAGKGKEYRNAPYLQVYGREGEACPVCGGALQRAVLGGRSSVFCPHCQS